MGEIMNCKFCKYNKKCKLLKIKEASYGYCSGFKINFIGFIYYHTIGRHKIMMSKERIKWFI